MDSKSLRNTLAGGIAFVKGVEQNRATSAITLDHLLQEHVTSIREKKVPQIDELESALNAAVKAVVDAGTDEAKLKELGVFEADSATRSDEEPGESTEARD